MAGLLDSIFGGGSAADDPYADILTPAQRNQMQTQGLLAMAGAFAQAGMPSRLPVPFGSALGSAAAALGTGQEAGMKTAIENALAAQKVRDLRSLADYRKTTLGALNDPTSPLMRAVNAINSPGGTTPAPGGTPAGPTAPAGPYAGTRTPAGAGASPAAPGAAGAPPTVDSKWLYPDAPGGGLLGSDVGAAGEYGAGQPATGLLGPGPPAEQRAGAASPGGGSVAAQLARGVPPRKLDLREDSPGPTDAAATPPVTSVAGAGGDTSLAASGGTGLLDEPWGPTFPQQAAARTGPARGETPQMTQLIEQAAAQRGVSPDVLRGLIKVESGFKPNAVSPAGAVGLAQLMPGTARGLGVTDPTDPAQAIPAAAQYLRQGLDAQGGDINRALMYYHGGPNTTMWGPKTQAYPGAVLAAAGGASPSTTAGSEDAGWGPTFAQGEPDRVIPSGSAANLPLATQAQYNPGMTGGSLGAGGAPAASGAPAAALPSMPQVPVPPGADPAKMNALILELARQNAASEVLGLGNPYNSLLTVLQGSPQYKAAVEAATEAARRDAGLRYVQPEAREKALGGYEVDVATRTAQANLDRVTEQIKQMGTAANTLAPDGILVPDGQGGMRRIQATVAQALRSANGLGVPELGIPPLQPQQQGAGGPGTMPQPSGGGGPIGQSVPLPGQVETQKALLDANLARSSEQIKKYTDTGQEAALQVANAQAINDLLPRVQLGWGADTRQEGARILSSMGVSQENIQKYLSTDPAAGDELKKLFLQFSSGAVRQMGAKEPGSVLELFRSAYPNLETHPDAAQLMNNALMMQARWTQDRAAAAQQWELTQQQNAGPTGTGYKGLLGFDQSFRKTNDPNEYWKAAAAMSKSQDIAWQNTNDQQQQRIFDLIPPGAIFRGPDGKIYQKPNR